MHITLKWQERERDIIAGAWPWRAICCLQWPSKAAVADQRQTGKEWSIWSVVQTTTLFKIIQKTPLGCSHPKQPLPDCALWSYQWLPDTPSMKKNYFCLACKRSMIKWDDIMWQNCCSTAQRIQVNSGRWSSRSGMILRLCQSNCHTHIPLIVLYEWRLSTAKWKRNLIFL